MSRLIKRYREWRKLRRLVRYLKRIDAADRRRTRKLDGPADKQGQGVARTTGTPRNESQVGAAQPTEPTRDGEVNMDWSRVQAAIIRAFWTFVFPMLGSLVVWLTNEQNLEAVGVDDAALASIIAAALYGLKKLLWPDTTI